MLASSLSYACLLVSQNQLLLLASFVREKCLTILKNSFETLFSSNNIVLYSLEISNLLTFFDYHYSDFINTNLF